MTPEDVLRRRDDTLNDLNDLNNFIDGDVPGTIDPADIDLEDRDVEEDEDDRNGVL